MNAGDFFAATERLPFAEIGAITRGRGLLVVAPHPDDESLGCGGLIAEACALGFAVRLVVVSDGVGSHPHSRSHPPAALRDLREAETIEAAATLGLAASAITFLRLPDRHVPTTGSGADEARRTILAMARRIDAGAVCVTWHHDPHCDHVAAATLAREACSGMAACSLFYYPIWGRTLPDDAEVGPAPAGFRFDGTRHHAAKLAAVAAHRSQTTDLIDDDPDAFRLTPQMIATLALRHEILIAEEGLRA